MHDRKTPYIQEVMMPTLLQKSSKDINFHDFSKQNTKYHTQLNKFPSELYKIVRNYIS